MFLEEVRVAVGETLPMLVVAYGHAAADAKRIWALPANGALAERGDVTKLVVGDIVKIPIPWTKKKISLKVEARGVGIVISRTGGRGSRLSWLQTVYRDNQPIGPNPNAYCVDACTPDDDLPFYFTNAEVAGDPSHRQRFSDHPSRSPPSDGIRTTRWRAIVSIAVVTGKRVTVFGSTVWGFNMNRAGVVVSVGPRVVNGTEFSGHLHLLANGVGTSGVTFAKQGWVFRAPPK